jgi:O-antigen/teichoic acid export membrane protein
MTGSSSKGTLGHGIVFGLLTFAATALIGLVSSVVVARVYGVDVVGQFALAYAPTGAVWVLSTIREQPAFVRAIASLEPRDPRATGLLAAVFTFSSLLTAVVCVIAAGVTYLLFNGPVHHPELFGLAVLSLGGYLLLTNPCWNLDSVLIAYRGARQLFWLRVHQALAYLGLAVAASSLSTSARSLVLATALSWLTPLLHRALILPRWISLAVTRETLKDGFRTLPELLRFGIRLTPGSLAQGASAEIGTWSLGALASVPAVGAYNRAWMLARRALDLHLRLTEMLFPTLVERRLRADWVGFDRALIDSLRYVSVILLLPAAVAGGAAHGILAVFGPGFGLASGAFPLLMLVPAFAGMSGALALALLAHDRPTATTVSFLVGAALTAPAVLLLTAAMGVTGTALGMVIGSLGQLVCQTWMSRPYVSGSFWQLWPRRQIGALALAYASGFLVARAMDPGSAQVLRLGSDLVAASIAYLAVLVLVGGVLPRDRERARALWSDLSAALSTRARAGVSGRTSA